MLITPPTPLTPTVAHLTRWATGIGAKLKEHNEGYRALMRKFGLSWSERQFQYTRELDPVTTGTPGERAAELAGALITAGFIVELDDETAQLMQSGAWQPEQKRWVKVGTQNGHLYLRWRDKNENLYRRAMFLPEARYDSVSRAVVVPPLYFAEVAGFAEEHDFRFTPAAQEALRQAERDYLRVLMPTIPIPTPQEKQKRKIRHYQLEKFLDLPERHLAPLTTLQPHQMPAVEKMLPLKVGGLFMDMGTGKTRCAIELAIRRQARTSKVIWFCPVSLKLTIAAEIAKHSTSEAVYLFDDKTTPDKLPQAFWYIVGLESLSSSDRVVLAVHALIDADTFIVVDESSYIKGHASKRSMRLAELAKTARYRLLLTGTPISQGVEDLYAQMRVLSTDILGYQSFYSFARNHLEYSEKYPGMIVRAHKMDYLTEKLAPFIYQVTKGECLDLPKKLYESRYFELTTEQKEAYYQAKCEILLEADSDDLNSYIIFQLFTALQQVVSGFRNVDGVTHKFPHRRLEMLLQVISEIPAGEKAIVWCKNLYSLRQIAQAYPDAALYYGDLNEKQRQAQLARFRQGARLFVATAATGGHGLTLNEAHYVIFYENEFKYSHRIQAEDRCHRIGQEWPVTYIDLVSNSGIDRKIQDALAKKQNVVRTFRDEVKKSKGMIEL